MSHSADDAVQRAEQLEREARDAIAEFSLEDALRLVREALAIREAAQGEGHPDLIWTLSLWIEALGRKHRPHPQPIRNSSCACFSRRQRWTE